MDKKVEILLGYLGQMTIFEIYGFGKLVGAEEAPQFEDYITNILVCYNDSPRKLRREVLALAKQVVEDKKKNAEVGNSQS